MDSQISELETKVFSLVSEIEKDFSPDRLTKTKTTFDKYIKEIDDYLNNAIRKKNSNSLISKLLFLKRGKQKHESKVFVFKREAFRCFARILKTSRRISLKICKFSYLFYIEYES